MNELKAMSNLQQPETSHLLQIKPEVDRKPTKSLLQLIMVLISLFKK